MEAYEELERKLEEINEKINRKKVYREIEEYLRVNNKCLICSSSV